VRRVARRKVANLLALPVLAFLDAGEPMHPYQLATVLRRTGKERDLAIKWGSLYTVVQNLEKHGFIAAVGSERAGRRPERTRYTITDAGRSELRDWLGELVAVPDTEPPRFQAALSVVGALAPDEVIARLDERVSALEAEAAVDRHILASSRDAGVARVFLIETEYALAMREAEVAWVRSLRTELADGSMTGVAEWREYHAVGGVPPGWAELLAEGGGPPES
jgi:DNA-binding PadR family transcriptional regulator